MYESETMSGSDRTCSTSGDLRVDAVRPAVREDIPQIVAIHLAAFHGSFLSQLGGAFLRGYYSLVLEHDGAILLVTGRRDCLEGFAAGFVHPDAFYRRMRRSALRLAARILAGLARRPSLVARVLYSIRRVGRQRLARSSVACELASIAVQPGASGKGRGRSLVAAFLDEAWARGALYVYLTTDADRNEATNRFYGSAGFRFRRRFEQYRGRRMNEYVISRHRTLEVADGG